jgi:hypothetical protein
MTGIPAASTGTADANGEISTLMHKLKIRMIENAEFFFLIVILLWCFI